MKKGNLVYVFLLMSMILLSGCGKQANESNMSETEVTSEETAEENGTEEQTSYAGTEYTWNEITVTIPDAWQDKYVVEENENGFSFIQKSSNEKVEGMGYICGFHRYDGPVFELAGERGIAFTPDQMYALILPTDVSFYYEDEDISAEYMEMVSFTTAMADSVVIDKADVKYNPDEYEIPMSDTWRFSVEDLVNFDCNELWIGRNEIYARHGMEFENAYLAEHFNACSWYEKTVTKDQFDEAVLTETEKANLDAIKEAESRFKTEHPYPIAKKPGEPVKADLAGNGTENTLEFQIAEVNKGDYSEYEASFNIDGKVFDLGSYEVYFENPELEDYYLTDISPYFDGLEIAVMDYGPSDDPVTHFFTYDGDLHYLGAVSGFPFKDYGFLDGFASEGSVMGVIRTDLLCTCYGYASWWYDYENKKLEFQDTGYYRMLPTDAHELYVDLPVYTEMNTDSVKTTIPAQKEVYFTLTDGESWLQVKGKDGSKGFLHVENGVLDGLDVAVEDAGTVFSNLPFYD
ncbi:MAG: YARHG domain-containing protein [Lachnospiraceae bacterium]|nr:YARHG domain-containing protein [Lachnospiraceae bacterium]